MMRLRTFQAIFLLFIVVALTTQSCGQKQEQSNETPSGQVSPSPAQNSATTSASTQAQQTPTQESPQTPTVAITPNVAEKQLLDTLLSLWKIKGNLTSLDQAGAMIGVEVTDSMRIHLLLYLGQNPQISERIQRYRPFTFVLNNTEKLVAQAIIHFEKLNGAFPSVKTLGEELKLSEKQIRQSLHLLSTFGFLYDLGGPDDDNPLGFSFGANQSAVAFDMGLRFHVFHVDDQPPFNVGCAKEAFYVLFSEFPKSKVKYETVDPSTLQPVTVVFDQSEIVSVSPDSAVILEGGTCGTNNLFVSGENAAAWAATAPNVRGKQHFDIRSRFATLKAEFNATNTSGK
jgi:hypothetical protein